MDDNDDDGDDDLEEAMEEEEQEERGVAAISEEGDVDDITSGLAKANI
jgi:hypothetical protein